MIRMKGWVSYIDGKEEERHSVKDEISCGKRVYGEIMQTNKVHTPKHGNSTMIIQEQKKFKL